MKSFKRILVAVDLDEPASWEECLPIAQNLAACFDGRITICSVADAAEALAKGRWWAMSYEEIVTKKHAELDALRSGLHSDIAIDVEVGTGDICTGVADVAARTGADLIILSEHQHNIARYFMDSKAERIAQKTSCSILMVKNAEQSERISSGLRVSGTT